MIKTMHVRKDVNILGKGGPPTIPKERAKGTPEGKTFPAAGWHLQRSFTIGEQEQK